MITIKVYIEKESNTIFTEDEMSKVLEDITDEVVENNGFAYWLDDAYEPSEIYDLLKAGESDSIDEEYKKFVDKKVMEIVSTHYRAETITTDFYYDESGKRVYLDK